MSSFLIKRSRFAFYAFGDSVSEKDFEASEFQVLLSENKVVFEFKLHKKLDYFFFYDEKKYYDTYVFEESFVMKKIISVLEKVPEVEYYKLRIIDTTVFESNLTTIKVQSNAIVFQAFQ
ncbi:hypothetical protein [Flavicella marina]|uniref:hypothetical protein n=1 Tax=Flavicella marina TaxID=1475951 RepID=UPI001264C701|nr:hypothetical protein [Flavicella marina]